MKRKTSLERHPVDSKDMSRVEKPSRGMSNPSAWLEVFWGAVYFLDKTYEYVNRS